MTRTTTKKKGGTAKVVNTRLWARYASLTWQVFSAEMMAWRRHPHCRCHPLWDLIADTVAVARVPGMSSFSSYITSGLRDEAEKETQSGHCPVRPEMSGPAGWGEQTIYCITKNGRHVAHRLYGTEGCNVL